MKAPYLGRLPRWLRNALRVRSWLWVAVLVVWMLGTPTLEIADTRLRLMWPTVGVLAAISVYWLTRPRRGPGMSLGGVPAAPPASLDQALELLEETEGRYRLLVETSPDAIGLADLEGRFLMVNHQAAVLHGYRSAEEMIAKNATIFDIVAPYDRARAHEGALRIVREGKVDGLSYDLLRADGTTLPVEIAASLIADAEGTPKGFIAVVRDVTARKQTELMLTEYNAKLSLLSNVATDLADAPSSAEALQLLADRLRGLADGMVALVSTYDEATNILTTRAIAGLESYLPIVRQFVDYNLVGATYPLEEQARRELLTRRLHPVSGIHTLSFGRIPEPAAQTMEQIMGIGRIYAVGLVREPEILGVAVVVMQRGHDVLFPGIIETLAHQGTTAMLRQRAEQALRESEGRYRSLFENIGDALILLDTNLRVVDFADTPTGSLGLLPEEVIGQPFAFAFRCFASATDLSSDLVDVLRSGRPRVYHQIPCAWPDSEGRDGIHIDVVAYRVEVHGQSHVALLCRDVAEQVRLEAQAQQAQYFDTVASFASGVVHDLGGLLGVIKAEGELLNLRWGEGHAANEEVSTIMRAVDRGEALRRQLLAFSRGQQLEREIVHLNRVVQDAEPLLHGALGTKVTLTFDLCPEMVLVWGDALLIERVLVNLAVNARDAMPEGGTFTIGMRMERVNEVTAVDLDLPPGLYAVLTAQDTGQGIARDDLKRLFDPFFTTRKRSAHVGLGLSVVSWVVQQHGGRVAVDSEAGHGATFTIRLPAVEADLDEELGDVTVLT